MAPRTVAALMVLALLVAACGSPGASAEQLRLRGTFLLTDPARIAWSNQGCSGTGGYADVKTGMSVVVKDAGGKIIANGQTHQVSTLSGDDGKALGDLEMMVKASSLAGTFNDNCLLWFAVAVPESDFYQVEVGRRGTQTYSRRDLDDNKWRVDLTLRR